MSTPRRSDTAFETVIEPHLLADRGRERAVFPETVLFQVAEPPGNCG